MWDGSANTRGKHLLAIKEAGASSLKSLLHDLNEAKLLSTLHMRQGLMADEAGNPDP